jgi:hypothetical protein
MTHQPLIEKVNVPEEVNTLEVDKMNQIIITAIVIKSIGKRIFNHPPTDDKPNVIITYSDLTFRVKSKSRKLNDVFLKLNIYTGVSEFLQRHPLHFGGARLYWSGNASALCYIPQNENDPPKKGLRKRKITREMTYSKENSKLASLIVMSKKWLLISDKLMKLSRNNVFTQIRMNNGKSEGIASHYFTKCNPRYYDEFAKAIGTWYGLKVCVETLRGIFGLNYPQIYLEML